MLHGIFCIVLAEISSRNKKKAPLYSSVGGMQMVAQNEWLTYWNVFLCFDAALTWQIGGLRQSAFLITHTYPANQPLCDAK
jgi:hypothetical protein